MFLHQVSILDTGEVCMELLKSQSGQERVKEVLRISRDGSLVGRLTLAGHMTRGEGAEPLYEACRRSPAGDDIPAQRRQGLPRAGLPSCSSRGHFDLQLCRSSRCVPGYVQRSEVKNIDIVA